MRRHEPREKKFRKDRGIIIRMGSRAMIHMKLRSQGRVRR